jgi:quinol monooxygenase YgiN
MVRLSVVIAAPADHARTLVAALRSIKRMTRLLPGCIECEVWTAEDDEGEGVDVHYHEGWATERAMEGRLRSDAFTKLLEVLEAAPLRPVVEFDFVSRRMGLEYVEAVRGAGR